MVSGRVIKRLVNKRHVDHLKPTTTNTDLSFSEGTHSPNKEQDKGTRVAMTDSKIVQCDKPDQAVKKRPNRIPSSLTEVVEKEPSQLREPSQLPLSQCDKPSQVVKRGRYSNTSFVYGGRGYVS